MLVPDRLFFFFFFFFFFRGAQVPFLILGIGADDLFIFMDAWYATFFLATFFLFFGTVLSVVFCVSLWSTEVLKPG